MDRMKEVIEFFKDPKKKSLTQLGIYFIFFIFVFIVLSGSPETPIQVDKNTQEKTAIETYKDMYSYTYKVTYTNLDKIDIIEGTYYKDKSLFNYNNSKYYYEDNLYIINNDLYYLSNIEYDITKIFNKNLYNIFSDLIEESKTTYKDGTIVINYTIDSNKIYKYLYGIEGNYTNLINVSITENENKINNILIDLTNLNINLTKIEIEYSYLDLITGLDFNKSNYTYEESL